jgi:hypothetical protein
MSVFGQRCIRGASLGDAGSRERDLRFAHDAGVHSEIEELFV